MTLRNILLIAALLMVTGCADMADSGEKTSSGNSGWDFFSASNDVNPNEAAYAAATDPVALRIAESADKAASALQDLARIEKTRRPPAPEPALSAAPNELQQLVTVEWVGNAEGLIQNLAGRLNYDVVMVGAAPKVPTVVRVNQRDRTIVEALRSIGEQATETMDLVVNPTERKMEIRYRNPEPTRS